MKNSFEIRLALETDAFKIAELIYSTSVMCCFTPEQPCPEWFKESVAPKQIANLLKSVDMVWLVATQEKTLAGVLAVSNKSHVKYFFVHPAHQKLGAGKQLWQFVLHSEILVNSVLVRSSLFAVPVYEGLGFKAIEPPKEVNGVYYLTTEAIL